jgi:hypothetical protein
MGEKSPALRVVLDTNTVVSALLFPRGQLGWMRQVWSEGGMLPLVSADTVRELIRVLAYPKFELDRADINATLSAYLPFIETLAVEGVPCRPISRRAAIQTIRCSSTSQPSAKQKSW